MQSFKEYFADLVLVEMAFNKKIIERKVDGLVNPINLHLVKLLWFEDNTNKQKHINDIMTWLYEVQDLDWNKRGKKMSSGFYFFWFFEGPYTNDNNSKAIDNLLKRQLKDCKNLKQKRTSYEVIRELFVIHKKISKLLSEDSISDIENYLLKL